MLHFWAFRHDIKNPVTDPTFQLSRKAPCLWAFTPKVLDLSEGAVLPLERKCPYFHPPEGVMTLILLSHVMVHGLYIIIFFNFVDEFKDICSSFFVDFSMA